MKSTTCSLIPIIKTQVDDIRRNKTKPRNGSTKWMISKIGHYMARDVVMCLTGEIEEEYKDLWRKIWI